MLRFSLSFFLMTCLFESQASADTRALRFNESQELLSNGKILSSASLTSSPNDHGLGLGVSAPMGARIHEVFILYRGEVYLCHLTGAKSSGTAPYASCYGSWSGQ